MIGGPPPWPIWESLANLTSWFHWQAISAFFSLGALLWAIHLADRGQRDRRRREASILKALLYPIATAESWIKYSISNPNVASKDKLKNITDSPVDDDMSNILLHIKISELPSTLAIDFYVTC